MGGYGAGLFIFAGIFLLTGPLLLELGRHWHAKWNIRIVKQVGIFAYRGVGNREEQFSGRSRRSWHLYLDYEPVNLRRP
jgi:hypothetical protein